VPGKKWFSGFFFDGINAKTAGAAIAGQHYLPAFVGADKTQAMLPFFQFAKSRAQITLHPGLFILFGIKLVPVFCCYSKFIHNNHLPVKW
jgi:hypothetical protein